MRHSSLSRRRSQLGFVALEPKRDTGAPDREPVSSAAQERVWAGADMLESGAGFG